jgi:hypothetical protein
LSEPLGEHFFSCTSIVLSSKGVIMPQNFLPSASDSSPAAAPLDSPVEPTSRDRESFRILVIGSRQAVTTTIQTLHRLRFAEVREWSPLLPAPNSGEVMSILTRYILMD